MMFSMCLPKFPTCSKAVPNRPTVYSLSFFAQVSKQACLLAMYVGGPKGKKIV
jgi:hypothetical protein